MDPTATAATARGHQPLVCGQAAWAILSRRQLPPASFGWKEARRGRRQVQRVEGQQPRPDGQQVIPARQQPVNAVLQAVILLFQLVKGGEEGGDVEVAGLLHEKAAALLPVSL